MTHCSIQNIVGVFLTMQSFVKWADAASLRFHKIPLATWGPFSDLHCGMQKPAPSCCFVPQKTMRCWSTLETFKWLQNTAGCQGLQFTRAASISHGVYPSGFAATMSPESLCITQCLPWNTMFSWSFTWDTESFANLSQFLNWSHRKPGEFCLGLGSSRCLWTFMDKAVCRRSCFSQATEGEFFL